MAFCSSKDMSAQYIKSTNVFLKPKPEPETAENINVITDDKDSKLEDIIDPVGLLIFAGDMNDEQRVSLFTSMTTKLFAKLQMVNNGDELAGISK